MYSTDLEDHHFKLKNEKEKILDKLWGLTQNYLDEHINDATKTRQELELLCELENTDKFNKLLEDLNSIKDRLNQFYTKFLDIECGSNLKKDKIIALKEKWGEEISNAEISRAANCSRGYVRQFRVLNGKVEQKDSRKSISAKIKKDVLKRDNYSCVACGALENLEIHHIIPIMDSAIKDLDDIDNLAALCKKCHYLAHSGNYHKGLSYKSREEFWEWTQNTEKTKMWLILKDIHGIGINMTENIYKSFSTIKELEDASIHNLKRVPLVNNALAKRIKFKLETKSF